MPVDFNESNENAVDSKEIGQDCSIDVPGLSNLPAENVSFSEEAETSEVQYNDGFGRSLAVTGVTYSGSFDIPGNAKLERENVWGNGRFGSGSTTLPKHLSTLAIEDQEKLYSFKDVMVSSHSKDIPGDDRTSHSFDFEAQELVVR